MQFQIQLGYKFAILQHHLGDDNLSLVPEQYEVLGYNGNQLE